MKPIPCAESNFSIISCRKHNNPDLVFLIKGPRKESGLLDKKTRRALKEGTYVIEGGNLSCGCSLSTSGNDQNAKSTARKPVSQAGEHNHSTTLLNSTQHREHTTL